ncbi:sugar phosphate isomerase/epimerase [Dysgonomonas sp. Marseille-P4677]|uniref:sugar phosphate isomerase/epimerase family protein n=1 Tax=Dysgonomonas sp. Marseille-P4677 TaxID=2364790 RepID=UPI001914D5DC|nr:sugar phosphate isomerase/epimerase [Dysgonomonas sp. Marseille-P4677]MBK5722184.1 sugar phosphate isomerase/epimerase [Dysgonomonas sp. Marseille-P4677]
MKKILLLYIFLAFTFAVSAQDYKIGTTTALWQNPLAGDFIDAKKNGIEYIEIALNQCYRGVAMEEVVTRVFDMKAKVDSAEIKVWSIHLPFSKKLDISVLDSVQRDKNVKFIAGMIELSAMFQPHRLILHPSSEPISDSTRTARIKNAQVSIDILRKYARKIGAELCVENLPRTCLGNTPDELFEIVEPFPDVKICFDTNHFLNGDPLKYIQKLGHKIGTIHVSDYDGINECHWIPGDGTIEWGKLVYNLKEAGYNGVFMYETTKNKEKRRISPQELANSYKTIQNQYDKYVNQIQK